jgi:uncharacterized protein
MKFRIPLFHLAVALLAMVHLGASEKRLEVLLIDGHNNHDWRVTTPILKEILERTGVFAVEVATAPQDVSQFRPKFAGYDALLLNYNGPLWPEQTRQDFQNYVAKGGGAVVVHAANNSFPEWKEYNQIIGLGGWGNRNEKAGPYLRLRNGVFVRDDTPGPGGGHGRQHEFVIETRAPEHPIMKGLPSSWLHSKDELYDRLRGPAENLTVLASAFSHSDTGGSNEHEPLLMTIQYGKGRVFHTALGHGVEALHGLGFQVTLQRGTEWAATGKVNIPAPSADDLPAEGRAATRKPGAIQPASRKPHIMFVTGDEEYRSEESMPMLARILKNRYGFRVSIGYAVNEEGFIDPNRNDNITNLEALEEADMMVIYTRFRKLPEDQMNRIKNFADSGKPMAGFRTSTHAFLYGNDHPMDNQWPFEVFGQRWISHHGHENSTAVTIIEEKKDHPVLRGVQPFHARSWLYHVKPLHPNAEPLLMGRAVRGAKPGGEFFGEPHPVAWTHNYTGASGNTSPVFFTTLGHPQDFFAESMRKLSLNGIFWALGMEDQIPKEGLDANFVGEYAPSRSGFGQHFKQGVRPEEIKIDATK